MKYGKKTGPASAKPAAGARLVVVVVRDQRSFFPSERLGPMFYCGPSVPAPAPPACGWGYVALCANGIYLYNTCTGFGQWIR